MAAARLTARSWRGGGAEAVLESGDGGGRRPRGLPARSSASVGGDRAPEALGTNPTRGHRSYRVAPGAGADERSGLGAPRTYRGPDRTVVMPDVTSVRDAARGREEALVVPVTVILDDAVVSGTVGVAHRGGLHYDVEETIDGSDAVERWLSDGSLDCSRDGAGMRCGHVDEAIESTRALLEARRIRTALPDLAQARELDAGVLGADHQASNAALEGAAGAAEEAGEGAASRWADNPAPFQAAYREARARRRRGEPAVPFMADNATGGLGAREGGRSFGVEMEFDIDPSVDQQRALQAIADDLHAEGILRDPVQESYHSSSDYTRWRYEEDETVDGEIITPIMYDEAESWAQLAKVCEVVRRHGGRATHRTGSHVHVGVGDFDHTVEHHRRLLKSYREHEDTFFRLAQNPDRTAHRGLRWCSPNLDSEARFGPPANLSAFAAHNNEHSAALNFEEVGTGSADSHVEYRMWDSTLDPAIIQTQVKLSLGLTQAAFASRQPIGAPVPLGTHRRANAALGRGNRLRGEAWEADTQGFRGLVDRLFRRDVDKAQAASLFAVTKWQRPRWP
jgi:hypothetical protein